MPKISELPDATNVVAADELVVVQSAVTKRVTANEVALSAPFTSRYAPLPASDTIRISAFDFIARTGSPVLSQRNTLPLWLMDGAATEDIASLAFVPSGWATYNVVVRYVNAGAGSGDVRWSYLRADLPADDIVTAATTSVGSSTSTAGATDVLKSHTIQSGVAVPASGLVVIQIRRIGGDAADTLADDIGVVYVNLVKAS